MNASLRKRVKYNRNINNFKSNRILYNILSYKRTLRAPSLCPKQPTNMVSINVHAFDTKGDACSYNYELHGCMAKKSNWSRFLKGRKSFVKGKSGIFTFIIYVSFSI